MIDVEPDMTRALKTFRKVPRYGHAVGRIMVHEADHLNWQRIERMLEASGFKECLDILLETDFGPHLEGAQRSGEVEEGLRHYLEEQYAFLGELCHGTCVQEFLQCKYDFHNVKVVLKEFYFGGAEEEMLSSLGSVDVERLRSSLEKPMTGNLPGYWEEALASLRSELEKDDGADPELVDVLVERMYLERRLDLARREKSRPLVNFARAAIDVANLRVLLRGRGLDKTAGFYRKAMAEGGRFPRSNLLELAADPYDRLTSRLLGTRYQEMLAGVLVVEEKKPRLTTLDRDSDEYLLEKMVPMARVSVGPERIVMYMTTRESEVVVLRIILMGKLHGIAPQSIERRLSRAYLKAGGLVP